MQVMNEDIAPTLREQMKHHEPIVCYSEKRFFEWHEDDKSVNIRASSGSYGGQRSACLYQKTIGALCQTDYKWVQQQQVEQGKLIIEKKGQDVDKLGWSANCSNTNDEQCRGGRNGCRTKIILMP